MAPPVVKAELTLSYPIWAADFDLNNADFLIVGGGGGESKTGVGNKITLLDASRKQTISEVVDIDLSRDEDSVTSLAVSQSSDTYATVLAGINSSEKDKKKGKNEHFRSFKLGLPTKRKRNERDVLEVADERKTTKAAKSEVLGKASLFHTTPSEKNETYQRVLRLSRPAQDSSARMGAIATGLAPAGEVVVFNATKPAPGADDVLKRIRLGNGEEAADVDLILTESGDYLVAYCTNYEVSVCPVSLSGKAKSSDPRLLYQYPIPDVFNNIQRPSFKFLRFLTPKLIAAVVALPGRSGAELLLVDIPSEPSLEGSVLLRKRFHRALKSANSFSIVTLPGVTPTQNVQHVLALAGQDSSVTVLTLDHPPESNHSLKFYTHTVLHNVHRMQLTSLTFSSFTPPSEPLKSLPQYLKLASAGIDSTVAVHTFPLTPYPTQSKTGQKQRYTLRSPSMKPQSMQNIIGLLSALVMIGVSSFLMQAFLEIRGGAPEWLGAKEWLPTQVKEWVARPYEFEGIGSYSHRRGGDEEELGRSFKHVSDAAQRAMDQAGEDLDIFSHISSENIAQLKDIIQDSAEKGTDPGPAKAVLVKDQNDKDGEAGVSAEVHHKETLERVDQHRTWEELGEKEKSVWREKLRKAGRWVEGETESILKGVFFGELAGAVGDAIRG